MVKTVHQIAFKGKKGKVKIPTVAPLVPARELRMRIEMPFEVLSEIMWYMRRAAPMEVGGMGRVIARKNEKENQVVFEVVEVYLAEQNLLKLN